MSRSDITTHNRRKLERLDNSFNKYSPDVVARPVDTFIRHQAPDMSHNPYATLASAMSTLSPKLKGILEEREKEKQKSDEARGMKLYHESGERLSWADWRKKMPKLKGLNEDVKNGYLRARMMNEANVFRTALNNAYASGEASVDLPDGRHISIAESDDPAMFNLWLNRFTKEYVKNNIGDDADPEYFATIFVPQLESAGQELGSKHISERNNVLWERNIAEHTKLMSSALSTLVVDGGITTDDVSMGAVASHITQLARQMTTNGVPTKAVKDAIINALIVAARNTNLDNGEELFDIAQNIELEKGVSLWDSDDTGVKLANAAENVRRDRYFLREESKRSKEEADEMARVSDENAIANLILNGKGISTEMAKDFIAKYNVKDFSNLTSNLRNIMSGVRDGLDGSGRGGGGGSAEKQLKAIGASVYAWYVDKIRRCVPVSVFDVAKDGRLAALLPEDTLKIIKLVEGRTEDEYKVKKDVYGVQEKVLEAEITEAHFPADVQGSSGLVEYARDVARYSSESKIDEDTKGHSEVWRNDPATLIKSTREIYRQNAKYVGENSEAVREAYAVGVPAWDPQLIEKGKALINKSKVEQAAKNSQTNHSVVNELLKRGLDPTKVFTMPEK